MSLAKTLRNARKTANDTVDKVSFTVGISNAYLSDLENGKALRPKIEIVSKLADYYGLDKDSLIILSGKIPQWAYWKIVKNPEILKLIESFKSE